MNMLAATETEVSAGHSSLSITQRYIRRSFAGPDQAHHEAIHMVDWNGQIMNALKDAEKKKGKKQKLTAGEIVTVAKTVMGQFGIASLPFVKYNSERPEK